MGVSIGRTSNVLSTDMVNIHVAVIAIISTFFITIQAGNVRTEAYDPYAQEPMDRMSLGLVVDYLAQDPKFVKILAETLYDFQDDMVDSAQNTEMRRPPSKKNSELLNSLLGLPKKHPQEWLRKITM